MTFSWWLVARLTCKSFVTFRSARFPQERWSGTPLSEKSEYLEELAINVLFWTYSQTSKWARSSAYFTEPSVQMTTPQVALNCLINCPPLEN